MLQMSFTEATVDPVSIPGLGPLGYPIVQSNVLGPSPRARLPTVLKHDSLVPMGTPMMTARLSFTGSESSSSVGGSAVATSSIATQPNVLSSRQEC